MKKFALATLTFGMVAFAASAQAVVIANWTFETSVPLVNNSQAAGPYAAEAGVNAASSFASGLHASADTDYSNPAGNGSVESFSANNWVAGDYFQFQFSLTGYQSATITWDQTRSSTGPADFALAVSTDGVNFSNLVPSYNVLFNDTTNGGFWGATYVANYNFAAVSLGASTDGAANVWVRMVSNVQTAAGGTNRVDNIVVDATDAVPEPATMAVLAAAGLAAAARRKRK